jgi:hypothetical protein
MSDTGKTKAEIIEASAQAKAASFDKRACDLVEKWLVEIRAIVAERQAPPLMRP